LCRSPTADSKPQRVGTLPSYNFSFKCDERAEKRKEVSLYGDSGGGGDDGGGNDGGGSGGSGGGGSGGSGSSGGGGFNSLVVVVVETLEAEIKQLKKNLTFKATPMPSFYQEPATPKAELKKKRSFNDPSRGAGEGFKNLKDSHFSYDLGLWTEVEKAEIFSKG
ncbi:hypothetical protein IFM89_020586, partial [Coptis chinensis]